MYELYMDRGYGGWFALLAAGKLAFDIVYDNMDVMNKYLELSEIASEYPGQIVILDMICFEHIVLSFQKLVEWTGTGKKNKIFMREKILEAIRGHKIEIGEIDDAKTRDYLMGFKHYSTEREIKAITYELTENDMWSVKGEKMGGLLVSGLLCRRKSREKQMQCGQGDVERYLY